MLNLASYAKLKPNSNKGEYIKFEDTGDTKYLRFFYRSGGDTMGEDVSFYRKHWDGTQKKFIYGDEKGQLTATLKCIEYDADGSNPRPVLWERSAYFCYNTLLPAWRNYPRIIDGVWKVTATSPRTIDASYALFPVMNADTIKYPIIEFDEEDASDTVDGISPEVSTEVPTTEAPKSKSKYWE